MAAHNKRFNIRTEDVSAAPARPSVTRAPIPSKLNGERRRILTAFPSGAITWSDFESARLNQTIAAKVASEKVESHNWKSKR